jgi:two-component system nitrogen regulation response regulator NtrX
MHEKILIVDDEVNILKSLTMILGPEEFEVFTAPNLKQAAEILKKEDIQLYLVDVFLPDGDGIEFIQQIREKQPEAVVIMISGHASIKMAIDATRRGADDFIEKPLSKDKLLLTLQNFVKRLQLQNKISELQSKTTQDRLIGESKVIQEVKEQIKKVAPTNSKILISGESGTGKEIVAGLIHTRSNRHSEAYVKMNCAAIPEDLIEAELFGVEKGAYTGATERREGKFKQADRGTIFLDEIADMSLKTQTKVLRVLQEGEFERVGGSETIKTDVRVIAATNKDLNKLVQEGEFREDLFFRLNVISIMIPPLRERAGDIPLIVDYFLHKFAQENNRKNITVTDAALEKLCSNQWPGNVRELRNMVERIVIMSEGNTIDVDQLPDNFFASEIEIKTAFKQKQSLREVRDQAEADYIRFCLERFEGNVSKTARTLGVDRTYLYKKIQKLGLKNQKPGD